MRDVGRLVNRLDNRASPPQVQKMLKKDTMIPVPARKKLAWGPRLPGGATFLAKDRITADVTVKTI